MKYTGHIIILIFLFSSCTYELDDIQVAKTTSPIVDDFKIELIINDSSQFVIYKNTQFFYRVTNNSEFNLGLKGIIVTIDGEEYSRLDNSVSFDEVINFTVNPEKIVDGTHTLGIISEAYYRGNNLANHLGVQNDIKLEWEILVDKTPEPITITSVRIEEGELVVYWDSSGIKNYDYLYLSGKSDNFYDTKYIRIERNENKTTFPYFLRGDLDFKINTYINEKLKSSGPTFEYELEESIVHFRLQDSTIFADFQKPSLYKHVKSFTINGEDMYTSFSADNFTVELENSLIFGDFNNYYIKFEIGPQSESYFIRESLGLGKDIPLIDNIIYSEINQSFYARYTGDIYLSETSTEKISGTFIFRTDKELNVLDTLIFDRVDSPYGPITMTYNEDQLMIMLSGTKYVYFLDPIDLHVISSINLSNDFNYNISFSSIRCGAKITQSNLLYIRGRTHIAINLDSKTKVFEGNGGIIGQYGDISDDGTYIFNDGNLYEWNGLTYEVKSEINKEFKAGVFLNNSSLLHFNDSFNEIIDAQTLDVTKTFVFSSNTIKFFGTGLENEGWIKLQKDKNRLISYESNSTLDVIDFNGVKLSSTAVNLPGTFYYLNNYLIATNGKAIKVTL